MKTLLIKLLAVGTSFLVGLPLGLCCISFSDHSNALNSRHRECCQHASSQSCPESGDELPNRPGAKCCCTNDATLVNKTTLPELDFGMSMPFALTWNPAVANDRGVAFFGKVIFDPDPPIRILHCVWRC